MALGNKFAGIGAPLEGDGLKVAKVGMTARLEGPAPKGPAPSLKNSMSGPAIPTPRGAS